MKFFSSSRKPWANWASWEIFFGWPPPFLKLKHDSINCTIIWLVHKIGYHCQAKELIIEYFGCDNLDWKCWLSNWCKFKCLRNFDVILSYVYCQNRSNCCRHWNVNTHCEILSHRASFVQKMFKISSWTTFDVWFQIYMVKTDCFGLQNWIIKKSCRQIRQHDLKCLN